MEGKGRRAGGRDDEDAVVARRRVGGDGGDGHGRVGGRARRRREEVHQAQGQRRRRDRFLQFASPSSSSSSSPSSFYISESFPRFWWVCWVDREGGKIFFLGSSPLVFMPIRFPCPFSPHPKRSFRLVWCDLVKCRVKTAPAFFAFAVTALLARFAQSCCHLLDDFCAGNGMKDAPFFQSFLANGKGVARHVLFGIFFNSNAGFVGIIGLVCLVFQQN